TGGGGNGSVGDMGGGSGGNGSVGDMGGGSGGGMGQKPLGTPPLGPLWPTDGPPGDCPGGRGQQIAQGPGPRCPAPGNTATQATDCPAPSAGVCTNAVPPYCKFNQ